MAISDEISRLQQAKSAIKIAIALKGVEIPDNVTLTYYDQYIAQITTGSGEGGGTGLLEIKQVTPTAEGFIVSPSEGYYGLSQVIVNGDLNLVPENIKSGVTIFGIAGSLETTTEAKLQEKSAVPTASGLTVTPDSGYDGLSAVHVAGDSALDPENIRKGATIFGVEGVFVGSGGNASDYNVFAQNSKPETANGIWLKTERELTGIRFLSYGTKRGNTINPAGLDYMKTTDTIVGQVIINGVLYSFGTSSSTSYSYNLTTHQQSTLNVPTITPKGSFGAVIVDNLIYVFYKKSDGNVCFYTFNINKNTSSDEISTGVNESATTYIYYTQPYLYDGTIYMAMSGTAVYIIEYNLNTKTSKITSVISNIDNGYFEGKYLWGICPGYETINGTSTGVLLLQKIDIITKTRSTIAYFTEEDYEFGDGVSLHTTRNMIYVNNGYVYSFYRNGNYTTNKVFRYNISSNTTELLNVDYEYYAHVWESGGSGTSGVNTNQNILLDETTGLLYIRDINQSVYGFQFKVSPALSGLRDNSIVIVQGLDYDNSTRIQSNSGLVLDVSNVYITDGDDLDGNFLTYIGDGKNWRVLKNPVGETIQITFDTGGGSAVEPIEVLIGSTAVLPTTVPTRDGAVFDGWYYNGEPLSASQIFTENATLTANWREYEELEFIQSSGTQWIDTLIYPKSTTRVETKIACLSNGYAGWASSSSQEAFFFGLAADGYLACSVSSNYTLTKSQVVNDYLPHVFDLTSGNQQVDGTTFGTDTIGDTATSAQTIYLFAQHAEWSSSAPATYVKHSLYYCKIWDGDTLVRDYIPIKFEDGTYALFDKANGVPYYNEGTGTFSGGSEQDPVYLTYIQSSGAQYVNTGFIPNQDTKVEMELEFDRITSQETLWCARGESNANSFVVFRLQKQLRSDYNTSLGTVTDLTLTANTKYKIAQIKNEFYVDDTLRYTHEAATFTSPDALTLFMSYVTTPSTTPANYAYFKMYSCKIWNNDQLVRNFVPYKDEYGMVCLLDTVENKKYYNLGAGNFIGG